MRMTFNFSWIPHDDWADLVEPYVNVANANWNGLEMPSDLTSSWAAW